MKQLRLALCQMNATVGDLDRNADKIIQSIDEARRHGCDLITFPELALTGYPPEDLLLKPSFIRDNLRTLDRIVSHCNNITAIVGFVDAGDDIFNAAAVANNGRLAGVYHKRFLPNYGVFDEDRYFQAGDEYPVFQLGDAVFGVNICEDIWYPGVPTAAQAQAGAELILNINASPFHVGKAEERARMLATRAADYAVIVAYNNLVGGQDELVFDGSAMVFDQLGRLQAESDQFREQTLYVDLDLERVFRARLHDPRIRKERRGFDPAAARVTKVILEPRSGERDAVRPATPFRPLSEAAQVYEALTLGTRDYVLKNGFNCAVHRPVWRYRLEPGCSDRGGCPRPRQRGRRILAIALLIGRQQKKMLAGLPKTSASGSSRSRSSQHFKQRSKCWRTPSPARQREWPRRTCRRASAATS